MRVALRRKAPRTSTAHPQTAGLAVVAIVAAMTSAVAFLSSSPASAAPRPTAVARRPVVRAATQKRTDPAIPAATAHRPAAATPGSKTVPVPEAPSDRNEYLPGTVAAGVGTRRLAVVHSDTAPTMTVTNTQAHGTYSLTPSVYGTVTSSAGGSVQGYYYVRTHGSSTWNLANGVAVTAGSGVLQSWKFADQMGTAGGNYDWQMKGCQSGTCSALTTITNFVIDPMVGSGNRSFMSYYDQKLSGAGSVDVNEGTGDLVIDWSDLSIGGVNGLGLNFSRAYNSITDPVNIARSDFGKKWTNSLADMQFNTGYNGDVYLIGPSGYLALFTKSGSTWTPPTGMDASVTYSSPNYTFTFHHDADGFRAGDVVTFGSGSYVTSLADKHGNKITFAYNPYVAGQVQSITDTQGRTVTLSNYNSLGEAQTVKDSTGRTLTYTYDANGNLTSFSDPGVGSLAGDAATRYGYDSSNRLTSITDPAGQVTAVTYVGTTGQVATLTRGSGTSDATTTQFTYYAVSDSHCTTQASYACTVVAEDRANATPNSSAGTYEKTTFYFDKTDRVKYVYDAANHSRTTSWDINSNVLTLSDKMSTPNITTATYDAGGNNNLTTAKDATGQTDTLTYTGSGHAFQPDTTTTPNNQATPSSTQVGFSYTAAGGSTAYGDLTKVTQGSSTVTANYQGDGTTSCGAKPGQACSTVNGKSGTTSYGYDTSGNLTSVTPPTPLGKITITPDALGRTVSSSDGKGQATTVVYDVLDRVTKITYPAGSKTMSYSYDGDGNVTGESVLAGGVTSTYTFTFDHLNRLTGKTLPANGTGVTTDTYNYDKIGNLTMLREQGGSYPSFTEMTENYTFNNLNLTATVNATTEDPSQNIWTSPSIGLSYDNDGRLTGVTNGASGDTRTLVYDNAGREVQSEAKTNSGTVLANVVYCYINPVASCPSTNTPATYPAATTPASFVVTSLKQRATNLVSGVTTGYTYDALSRMTAATRTAGGTDSRTYGYDADGNRTSQNINGTSSSYTYNAANESTSSGYTYDADGNATTVPTVTSLIYNPLNQITAMTASGSSTNYVYAGGTQDIRTSANGVDAADSAIGADIEHSASTGYHFYVRSNTGTLLAIVGDTGGGYIGARYPVFDGTGSVVALTNGSGTVTDTWSYDPYGVQLSRTGTSYNPWQYAGGYHDGVSGLYHFGARYYDPNTGRFTQQDPSGQTNNLFVYAGDSPVNYTDPTGLDSSTTEIGGCVFFICAHVGVTTDSNGDDHLDLGGGVGTDEFGADYTSTVSSADATDSGFSGGVSASADGVTDGADVSGEGVNVDTGVDIGTGDGEPSAELEGNYEF